MIERWRPACVNRHRCRKPALELVVVVAVQEVVLAVVLILYHRLDRAEAAFEERVLRGTPFARAVGPAAPGNVSLGEVAGVRPAALVDQCLQAGTVGAGLRAEDAVRGQAPSPALGRAVFGQLGRVGGDLGGERVVVRALVESRDRAHRGIEEVDQARKGVAEEARDPERHIDSAAGRAGRAA